MATTTVGTRVSAGGYPHPHGDGHVSPPPTPLSATLVNVARRTERSSIKLKFTCGSSDIVNSVVVDAAGGILYSTSSDSKRTTLVSCGDNVEIATIEWDHSSPRMVFRRQKIKCKDWLPLAGPDTESRVLTHGGAQFTWMLQSSTGYLIPANRPGLAVARWRVKSRTDILHLEVFQEALVDSGLLEKIVLSVLLLRSGRAFGDLINKFSLSFIMPSLIPH
ncbi:hypothetical protein BJV74DRAFT_868256 [Russula compacta]|nr:hypothetical protein BJV74DRAFT_868256 [Russula compacta]